MSNRPWWLDVVCILLSSKGPGGSRTFEITYHPSTFFPRRNTQLGPAKQVRGEGNPVGVGCRQSALAQAHPVRTAVFTVSPFVAALGIDRRA